MNPVPDEELFTALKQMRSLYPEMRFAQLVCNLATWARGPQVSSVWDVEDQELIDTANRRLQDQEKRC